MKPGFSVLELIMAMAISTIIMTTLLEMYNQITRNMVRVERFVFEDTQLLVLKNRFSKDIAGLSAIWFTQAEVDKKIAGQNKKAPEPDQEKRQASAAFYSINKQGRLEQITFVTTSALQSYGTTQDRFVRVVYKVEEDPASPGLFRLMRKQIPMPTEHIDEQALQGGTFYELVSGIKSISMTYQLIDKVQLRQLGQGKQDDAAKHAAQSEKSPDQQEIIRSVKQWTIQAPKAAEDKKDTQVAATDPESQGAEDEQGAEKEENIKGAAAPTFIEMKIVFGATTQQLEHEYKLVFYVPTSLDLLPKSMLVIKKPVEKSPKQPDDAQQTSGSVVTQ